ncbi:MAG TPA: complex I subunit 1 family protein, partial [archaeon]|nr:complex I subunit 1 family protein [archaeon]
MGIINLIINLAIKALIFPGLVFIMAILMFAIWFERKMWARVHLRIGPLHVGKYAGILQPIADFLKFAGKETIIPKEADKLFFQITPILAVLVAGLSLAVIPFSENWIVFNFNLSLLFVLAVYSLFPIIILLTGWASNNKYSFIGALRAVFQLLAYWVPLSLSMLGVVMIAQSLSLVSIVNAQSKFWFILLQPLGFLVCFIAVLAESERTPFDIPEAEGEIIWGWMTEYTGINFGLLMVANYLRLYIGTLILTTLF